MLHWKYIQVNLHTAELWEKSDFGQLWTLPKKAWRRTEKDLQNTNSCGPRNKMLLSEVTTGRGQYNVANISSISRATIFPSKTQEKTITSS